MVTKAIQPGQTSIDIYRADLEPELVEEDKGKKEVPWKTFLGYEFIGHTFEELVVLFPISILEK
jgi:hypothetical protein